MYTTAGFVVLGGLGAVWSHRPATIENAAASQFAGVAAAGQLTLSTAQNKPAWTQRLIADLSAQKNFAAKPIQIAAADDHAIALAPHEAVAPRLKPVARKNPGTETDRAPVSAAMVALPNVELNAFANPAPTTYDTSPFDSMLNAHNAARTPQPDSSWDEDGESIAAEIANDIQKVIEVRPGDTLYGVLVDAGVTEDDANNAVGAIADVFSPRDLRAGQEIKLNITTASGTRQRDADPQLMSLSFEPDVTTDVKLTRSGAGDFVASAIDKPIVEENRRAAGIINSSLFDAAQEAGVPMPVVADLIKTFSFDVDFQRDIQDGDSFEVLYERMENDSGAFVKSGKILFASLTLSGRIVPVYYFERDGDGEYFTPNGEAIRKSLLRTPVDGARITSGFGMRMHPLLGYSKMHKGIDFGAPTGTPIYAAGSGTIVEMGKKGAYGNYVRIRHNGEYQTAYAHMSRFAKGLVQGEKVKQGDVIGYVGATGRATGPHLHYEILVAGEQINPAKVKTVASNKLNGKQLKAFQAQVAKIDAERKRQADQQLIAERPDAAAPVDCTGSAGCQN
ncbi:MAG TPA: peptidoglycan DD-metalloendopeptidase family protein [Dongiaceae bacterium]|jgi:murein DD-endopeptidase MepM/ murein hydrolase activator NlpD|nr:peptidoglycan DD-metalloendopeptidase family protein [Dongiaceae bacterium]